MKRSLVCLLSVLAVFSLFAGCAQGGAVKDLSEYSLSEYMEPVWKGDHVYNETAMVLKEPDGSVKPIGLLYGIKEVVSVRDYRLETLYEEGKDYSVSDGKLVIEEDGAIYADIALDYSSYYTEEIGNNMPCVNGGGLLETEANYGSAGLGEYQVVVTYLHEEESVLTEPECHAEKFPSTIAKLKAGEKTNIVLLGDSISAGWSASGYQYVNIPPYCPVYLDLVTEYLAEEYDNTRIDAANFSVGGMMSSWGAEKEQIDKVIKEDPDLFIIAFGMNDGISGGVSPDVFKANTASIIDQVRAACPDAEIILVSTMMPNAEVQGVFINQFNFIEPLRELAAEYDKTALADVGSLSVQLLQHKKFRDLSCNNVNHPNDFMQRIYAQTIVKTLTENY